ncbi:MAG: hypothetical protein IPN76_07160 [Saprospiraceae bacterium]|nr:hypothetical protein [Saprospiraceae bacterium]
MQLNSIVLLLLLPFSLLNKAEQPISSHIAKPKIAFCDELAKILAGMNDNFNALKGNEMGHKIKYWNSKITLPNTTSNYILTNYDFNGKPLTNSYYAVLGGNVGKDEKQQLIKNFAHFMDNCTLPGFTRKVDEGIMQFTDDPALTADAAQSIHWVNKAANMEIALTYYYDIINNNDKVGIFFKAPYKAGAEAQKSSSSTTASKFTIRNYLTEEIMGYWVNFDGMEVYYFSLKPNQEVTMDSYTSHVWRIKSAKNNHILKTTTLVKGVEILELK